MRLVPHIESVEIECENPLEYSIMQRWLKCNGQINPLFDYGASGPTGIRGIVIIFAPKNDVLLPSPPAGPAETGQPGFRG